jgi:glucan 1,3-beta-glucosidase
MRQLQSGRPTLTDAARVFRPRFPGADDPFSAGWVAYRFPLFLAILSFVVIAGFWSWLGSPVASFASRSSPGKLDCVSYAPFRGVQDPLTPGLVIAERQIAEDFAQLARISDCVRTYSTGNGLDKAPALARKAGLKLLLGIWIGTQPLQNAQQSATAVALANQYPDVVSAIVVGNEVMLRKEMTPLELAGIIRAIKSQVTVPVTYADVWDVWLRSRELAAAVDFLTIHILPYWDDLPIRAESAAAHVASIRQRIAASFPGKQIFIGEIGWPSAGRMREGALPSPANQLRVVSDVLALARHQGFRVNLIEAYDQPWKRRWEGTVGAHWGLFDSETRVLKYPADEVVVNHPFWKLQLCVGLAFCVSIFWVAFRAVRKRRRLSREPPWVAVAFIATIGGTLLGMALENLLLQSLGPAGWIRSSVLLVTATVAPLICANALVFGFALPTLMQSFAARPRSWPLAWQGALQVVFIFTTLAACETAVGLVFDPRYRDFPFAPLTMAALPYLILRSLNRPRTTGSRPLAEPVIAGLLGVSAGYVAVNEGAENWQSLWTCAAWLAVGITLCLAWYPMSRQSIFRSITSRMRAKPVMVAVSNER